MDPQDKAKQIASTLGGATRLDDDSVNVLLEALPYIREFHGKTVVIKYGGAAMRDESLRQAFADDVVLLKYVGLNPVIIHGGGPEITKYMERMGIEVRFQHGLRVSDAETVEIASHAVEKTKEIFTGPGVIDKCTVDVTLKGIQAGVR